MNARKIIAAGIGAAVLLTGCADDAGNSADESAGFDAAQMNQKLLDSVKTLPESSSLYFENGLEISGLGVTFDGRPTDFDGCYFFPAIEKMTGVRVKIDWHTSEAYSTTVATTLLSGKSDLPDIINPMDFGVMELADDELIIPLDDYIQLMPDIVSAVGEEHMEAWKSADGHIYTIPSVSTIRGSFSMMIRQDWLDALGLERPEKWEDWLAYWRGVRDNDLNGNGDPTDEIPFACVGGMEGERSLGFLLNVFGIAASNDTQFCVLDDGTYTMVYEHPRYPEFLEAVAGLYAEGLIAKDYASYSYSAIESMMGANTLGSAMTFAASGAQTAALREAGDTDALWVCVAPVKGPYGDSMIPERELVSPMWCITAGAKERGNVENIVRFFNWCFTEEGSRLYNYGIKGASYSLENGNPILDKQLVSAGFGDYRAVGINYEPFGGYWLQDAYMQCLFAGAAEEALTDIQSETYNGLFKVNNDYFYVQPLTIETPSYVLYRTQLITEGVCVLRDRAISGEISLEEFFSGWEELKENGLAEVIDSGREHFANATAGEND